MSEQRGGNDAKKNIDPKLTAVFFRVIGKLFDDRSVACEYSFFSWGKGEEAVGNSKQVKRVKGLEGKPPAEEQRAVGPEEMKE